MEKIFMVSLGCPKNLVDSENVLGMLGEKGYILTDSPEEADLIIVNTCAFLEAAVRESESAIARLAGMKAGRDKKLLVCGCLVQRHGQKVLRLKGVDGIAGAGDPEKVVEAVKKAAHSSRPAVFDKVPVNLPRDIPRLLSTYPYAYLKIAEGCDNRCSYCLIPSLRGPLRSRDERDIIKEAEDLLGMSVRELLLVAQATAGYGRDMGVAGWLEKLLSKLVKTGFPWIRLMYLHPAHVRDGLLEIVAREKSICRYLDIPFQHSHPEMMEKMNRPPVDSAGLVEKIRKAVPGIKLRTTLMVGFPGESESHFRHMLDFVRESRFDRLGVFRYSREKDTSAYGFRGHVSEEEKGERERIIMEAQKKISEEKMSMMEGAVLEVLVEKEGETCYEARTQFDAPEIDGRVLIKKGRKKLNPGDFCRVRITSSDEYDLFALQA